MTLLPPLKKWFFHDFADILDLGLQYIHNPNNLIGSNPCLFRIGNIFKRCIPPDPNSFRQRVCLYFNARRLPCPSFMGT
jgi:hypothetical protein